MWRKAKSCWIYLVDEKKVGFVTFENFKRNEIHFHAIAEGKYLYSGPSLAHAKLIVENQF